jgi:C-terminal processing protease CtpA/Prc
MRLRSSGRVAVPVPAACVRVALSRPRTQRALVLLTSALRAGDVDTRIVPPALSSAFQTDTTGQLVHTGIQVARAPRAGRNVPPPLLVAGVMEGSAAERAGISVGSQLLAINGRSTAGLPDECALLCRAWLTSPVAVRGSPGRTSGAVHSALLSPVRGSAARP